MNKGLLHSAERDRYGGRLVSLLRADSRLSLQYCHPRFQLRIDYSDIFGLIQYVPFTVCRDNVLAKWIRRSLLFPVS